MNRILPYALGAVVLLSGALVLSRVLPQRLSPALSQKHTPLSAKLRPVRIQSAPEVLYLLVAEALVEKLGTENLLLTFTERHELVRQTSLHLREDLGLDLPPGFTIPARTSASALECAKSECEDTAAIVQQVQAANRDYLEKIVGRLLDQYAPQTMQLMSERLAAISSFRKPGNDESLHFVKALYGDSFVDEYTTAHQPKEDQPKASVRKSNASEASPRVARPAKEVAAAQAQVSSLWQTEFGSAELPTVREYILNQHLQGKLRDDLLCDNLSAAERSLMEKSPIGCRLLFLHELTCKILAAGH